MIKQCFKVPIFISASILLTYPAQAEKNSGNKDFVFIYYANETVLTPDVRRNYELLEDRLKSDRSRPTNDKIIRQVWDDAKEFPEAVYQEIDLISNTLSSDSSLAKAVPPLLIFSNKLARDQRSLRILNGVSEELSFTFPKQTHFISQANPLAQAEVFSSALSFARQLYDPNKFDFILITKSHGSATHALVPRIMLDMNDFSREEFFSYLDQKIKLPKKANHHIGTEKPDYLSTIEAQQDYGMHFPLLYMEVCKSQNGIKDKLRIPRNADLIYAPDHEIKYSSLDYRKIFDTVLNEKVSLTSALIANLDEAIGAGRTKQFYRSPSDGYSRWWYFVPLVVLALIILVRKIIKKR